MPNIHVFVAVCWWLGDFDRTTNKAQRKLKAHLHFTPQLPLHNPCITTAGSNAFPSSAAALDLPSQFIFPLNCAQLSVPRRAQPRAEPSCHAGLSAPNPGLAALPAGLVKKQMAVTDPPCDCGQLIAQDNSEIRT